MLDDLLKNLNLGDMGGLMNKARQMQDQAKRVQEEMARKTVTADAGGGMVQATVNGRMELTKLKIDKTKVDVNDTELLEDVIVAAVHGAQAKAAQMMQEEMQKMASQLGLPPGMLGM
jgi:DNA-binding YbaB/EbfC family protein